MAHYSYFDAHTHAQFLGYGSDRDEMLARAKAAGIKMITVGTQYSTSLAGVKLAEEHPGEIWATVGYHPAHANVEWHHDKNEQEESAPEVFDYTKFKKLAEHPAVVAIGECGLDYFRIKEDDQETRARQKAVFLEQIKLAHEVGKPLMIHCRAAFDDLITILKSEDGNLKTGAPGAIHFFTGTPEDARKLLDLGFSFTFGGVITFSRDYNEVIKMIPLDRILSETDAPYVSPAPYRGKRNEPAYVVEVVKKLAELKGISTEEMAGQIFKNVKSIFRLVGDKN